MSKSQKYIILTLITLLFAAVITFLVMPRPEKPVDVANDNEQDKTVSSMEGGDEVTQDDIDARNKMDNFAKDHTIQYLKQQYPNHQTIIVKDSEWYYTDQNNSYNVLVRSEVIMTDGTRTEELNVVEIGRTGDTLTNKQIYKPDERYSL